MGGLPTFQLCHLHLPEALGPCGLYKRPLEDSEIKSDAEKTFDNLPDACTRWLDTKAFHEVSTLRGLGTPTPPPKPPRLPRFPSSSFRRNLLPSCKQTLPSKRTHTTAPQDPRTELIPQQSLDTTLLLLPVAVLPAPGGSQLVHNR